jgi:hypothetical protein
MRNAVPVSGTNLELLVLGTFGAEIFLILVIMRTMLPGTELIFPLQIVPHHSFIIVFKNWENKKIFNQI